MAHGGTSSERANDCISDSYQKLELLHQTRAAKLVGTIKIARLGFDSGSSGLSGLSSGGGIGKIKLGEIDSDRPLFLMRESEANVA